MKKQKPRDDQRIYYGNSVNFNANVYANYREDIKDKLREELRDTWNQNRNWKKGNA